MAERMKSFAVGMVIEPEMQTTQNGKQHVIFGFLVGKCSETFDVWEDNRCFAKAASLKEGDRLLLIVKGAVDKRNELRYYINDIADAPEGLRQSLLALFQPPVAQPTPQQPQPEQANKAKAG